MATTKTKGTNSKIKELKGIKPEKVTDEQLQKNQETVTNLNRSQLVTAKVLWAIPLTFLFHVQM